MSAVPYQSPYREGDEMITPESRDPEQVMNILLVEVRALAEAFKEFKEDQKNICRERIHDCKESFGEVFGRLRVIEAKAAKCDALEDQKTLKAKTEPHWAVAKATYLLTGVTVLLVLDVALNIYRFFSGGGH